MDFNVYGNVYSYKDVDKFFKELEAMGITYKGPWDYQFNVCTQSYDRYLNIPCGFDTETTSYIVHIGKDEVKTGAVYIWMFGMNGIVIYGRHMLEWLDLMDRLRTYFRLSSATGKYLLCYIHNLEFDFQFFRKEISIDNIFIMDNRKALYIRSGGIEFRCSYILTGESLAKVGEHLMRYKVNKLVGDLDYNKKRHYNTKLTKKELNYCINDVRVIMAHIMQCIDEENGRITQIPLTATGYVRRDVRQAVLSDRQSKELVQSLQLTVDEYDMWKSAFQGGFTHANILMSDDVHEDVTSYDFTSSYPTCCFEQFPMSNGELVEWGDWETDYDTQFKKFCNLISNRILVFDIEMFDIKLRKGMPDAPLSESKCHELLGWDDDEGNHHKPLIDNGRVRRAGYCKSTMSHITFIILQKYYTFKFVIRTCYSYRKGYLPKPIIEKILEYYEKKTSLKNVVSEDGSAEQMYLKGKQRLNAIFGMMVMDIIREVYGYDRDWLDPVHPSEEEKENIIAKYNRNRKRFNWYPWGCMITEYARYNLLMGIYEVGKDDYIYSDTDSMKILNAQRHLNYITTYNREITEKLQATCRHYNIDISRLEPKTVKGEPKPLGVWDFDGHYKRFKVLHAKCYIAEDDEGTIHATIAGIAKKKAEAFLMKKKKPFDVFDYGMKVSAEQSGKLCHGYCDDLVIFKAKDYKGEEVEIESSAGICLEPIPFEINPTDYLEVMKALKQGKGE